MALYSMLQKCFKYFSLIMGNAGVTHQADELFMSNITLWVITVVCSSLNAAVNVNSGVWLNYTY